MTRFVSLAALGLLVLALTGCAQQKEPCRQMTLKDAPDCEYCAKTQRLVGFIGNAKCEGCGRYMPTGKWCEKCNRFNLRAKANCPGCNARMDRGTFCDKCKMYAGLPQIGYSEKNKQPYMKTLPEKKGDKK